MRMQARPQPAAVPLVRLTALLEVAGACITAHDTARIGKEGTSTSLSLMLDDLCTFSHTVCGAPLASADDRSLLKLAAPVCD